MGYGGTNPPIGYDLMNDVGTEGYLIDQRGPHYFDVRAEAVYLSATKRSARTSTSRQQRRWSGPIVLSSVSSNTTDEPGFRIIGRYDICPLSVLEFGYMGIFDFEDEASFTDTDAAASLFSLFSEFGTDPTHA